MVPNRAEEVLREIERMAGWRFFPILGPHRGRILVDVIRKTRPRRILEIGTNLGYSTILMGKELGSDAQIITIEIHPDEAKMAEENIRRAEIQPTVEVLGGTRKRFWQDSKASSTLSSSMPIRGSI
ncbi:MAG: O-methyltransferase [Candidatus Bathyarchaeia archaeon]